MHRQSVSPGALRVTNRICRLPARSLLYSLLIAVGCQMQAAGLALTGARADDASAALYPGGHVTNCKPAPIAGCVCESDSAGQMLQLLPSTSESADDNRRTRDIEHSRMIEWMRLTCIAVTQSRKAALNKAADSIHSAPR
jgi:hypothetical protein